MNQFYVEQAKLHIDALKRDQPENSADMSLPEGNAPQVEQTPPTVGHRRVSVLVSVLAALGIGKRRGTAAR